VINVDIKLVGTVNDENALDEIESIMNVFAYEQRMKDYLSLVHPQPLVKKLKISNKKIGEKNKLIPSSQPHILVKGLC
jgi:hypothetical protein